MRIAFVDLMFSWPPLGGADVDLFHAVQELRRLGHETHVFAAHDPSGWDRGMMSPDTLPFPASRLDFPGAALEAARCATVFRDAVDAWRPDAVFVCDGFFLKPYVILALAHYPIAARYYAYEMACHRDMLRFKDGAPCPNAYLRTPDLCRRCALESLGPRIRRGGADAWTREYLAARAYAPEYHAAMQASLARVRAAVVSNAAMKALVAPYCPEVFVIPGGVDLDAFAALPMPTPGPGGRRMILMPGRAEDPAKGAALLREAGAMLWAGRQDFQMVATMPEDTPQTPWFQPVGWKTREALAVLYQAASICVVPSLWEEPFGLVALEAMACGRPVCAARTGGLAEIVVDEETGLLFERGDAADLARCLERLLADPALAARMGAAGRRRAASEYAWEHVVARHYPPVLARLRRSGEQ